MNAVRKFKNLMSILMLYASNIIVPSDRNVIVIEQMSGNSGKRITGKTYLKLPAPERN